MNGDMPARVAHARGFGSVIRAAIMMGAICCGLVPSICAAQSTSRDVRIAGTVLDARAKPVAGAAVGVLSTQGVERLRRERPDLAFNASTDSRGRFVLVLPRANDTVSLVARAVGMAPARGNNVTLDSPAQEVTPLALSAGVIVQGRVIDEERKPLQGASVQATSEEAADDTTPEAFRSRAVSAADGSFQLRGIERGKNTLAATLPPRVARYLRHQTFGTTASSPPLEVMLFSPTFLRGQVIDSSGKPVAGAQLSAASGTDLAVRASADAQGRFELGPLARGAKVEFRASAAGFTPMRTDDLVSPMNDVTIRLSRNGTLRGRVLEAGTGRAVTSFEVIFQPKGPLLSMGSPGSRAFRADDGRFEWNDVLAGTWHASIRASGYQTLELPGLAIPAGGRTPELTFEVQKGFTARGRVIDRETGTGVAGAVIVCSPADASTAAQEPGVPCFTQADANGGFTLKDLPSQAFALTVSATGYSPAQSTVVAGEAPVEVLLGPGASIAGTLFNADSMTPAAGAVTLESSQGFTITRGTGAQGAFNFDSLAPGTYRLTAEAPEGRAGPTSISLRPSGKLEGVVLKLERGGTLRGTVSGLMPGERGRVNGQVLGASGFEKGFAVDELGAFELRGVPKGWLDVTFLTGLQRQLSRRVEMTDSGTATVDVAFPSGYRLSGRISRAGQPARFIKLIAHLTSGDPLEAEAESTQAGQYVFEGLPEGRYQILISGSRVMNYTLARDSVLDLDLPALTVAGVVTNATDGRPVEGALVEVRSGADASPVRISDNSNFQGGFDLAGLDAGEYRLSAYKAGYDLLEQSLPVASSMEGLKISLVPTPGVKVRVRDAASGAPLGGVMVIEMLGGRNGNRFELPLDQEGVGRLPPSLTGRQLVVVWPGYAANSVGRWNGQPLDLAMKREER